MGNPINQSNQINSNLKNQVLDKYKKLQYLLLFHCPNLPNSWPLLSFQSPPYNILGRACQVECLEGRDHQSELRNGVINQAKPSQLNKGQPVNRNTPLQVATNQTNTTLPSQQ